MKSILFLRSTFWCFFFFTSCLCTFPAPVSGEESTIPPQDLAAYKEEYDLINPQERVEKSKTASDDSSGPHFHNLIENPRILFDLVPPPPARWDLSEKFQSIEQFQGIDPILTIVEPGETKIVEPSLEGNTFILNWKGIGNSEITLEAMNPETGFTVYDKIRCEAWTPNYWTMFFSVVGGVGIFLLGMKYMSEGLQTVAGESLRRMIALVTDNRFLAIGVGLFTTALIQSSSVTTVMVVGFINSQIMTLSQGIGVIMGANIGTTITGWILVLDIGKYGLPILGFAGFVYMFSKHDKTRFIAMAVMGLGFVFFGLELMQKGFAFLRDLPSFTAWMNSFHADTYIGVLKCVGIGCLLTLIVQSSSATLAITISLAAIGIIPYETAGALVLGENIGTTITAFLASIGSTTNARRAAYFHILFNVIGVAWVSLLFLSVMVPTIKYLVGTNEHGVVVDTTKAIALTHTLFNVINTLLFIPFTRVFADLLTRFVPEREGKEKKSYLTGLHVRLLETSAISIERSRVEVLRMSNDCTELAQWVETIVQSPTPDEKLIDQAFRQEEVLDMLQDEVIEFMADLLSGNVSHDVAEIARSQLKMADELESISDYLIVILKSALKLQKSGLTLPEPIQTQICELHNQVEAYMLMIHRYYAARKDGIELLTEVHAQGRSITSRVKSIRDIFLKQMSEDRLDPQVIMAVNTQLNAYRRVREHSQNVAEAIVGVK